MANIKTVHEQYAILRSVWSRCRDAFNGEDDIHAGGETYLPKLSGQTDEQFDAYKLRARFFNSFAKTISGYVGLVMRKPVNLDISDAAEELFDNIDRSKSDVSAYFKKALEQVLEVGRYGTLVEYPEAKEGATLEDTKGARPYWSAYKVENILDWEYTEGELSYVVLLEVLTQHDEFYQTTGKQKRYRALMLEKETGNYIQEIWTEGDSTNSVVLHETFTPKMNSKPLKFIPFMLHQPDYEEEASKPPLLDLVNLCISHYRLKADHAHALHYVALPTPWVTGIDPDDPEAPTSIGPQKLWVIGNENAKVGMLEFTGSGIKSIAEELTNMEEQMAMLGARLLMAEVEQTATAAKIKSLSETSDLHSIITVMNTQFNWLMKVTSEWAGTGEDASMTPNTDFIPVTMDAQMLLALVKSWVDGAYDYKTLAQNLQRGEIVDQNMDIEELEALVEKEQDDRMAADAKLMESAAKASATPAAAKPVKPVA